MIRTATPVPTPMPHEAAWLLDVAARAQAARPGPRAHHRGRVEENADGGAMIPGLPDVRLDAAHACKAGEAVRSMGDGLRAQSRGCRAGSSIRRAARWMERVRSWPGKPRLCNARRPASPTAIW